MTGIIRRDFIPDVIWPDSEDDHAVDRRTDPEAWEAAVDADIPLVTQWDDGEHTGPEPGRLPTSSASQPSTVEMMFAALAPESGGHYLEVGTGTGYTAARINEKSRCRVLTVEVDPELAEVARENCRRVGIYGVSVVTGDGFVGLDREGPYNGIHVTAGVRQVPYAWLEQCLPGARIVMPWGTDFNPYDRLLTLTVGKDSRSASGRFAGALSYMKLRTQRLVIDHNAYTPDGWWDAGRERETALELKDAEEMTSTDTSFVLGLKVPDCVQHPNVNEDGSVTVWLYSTRDKSVAVATFSKGEPPDVTESGDRSLWAEVEGAYTWWVERDSPQPEQFGLTVAQQEQRVWLDSPTGESWALS